MIKMLKAILGITRHDQPIPKAWVEFSVDTYWTRHTIVAGASLKSMATIFRREHRGVTLDCIGVYTGPKNEGEVPGESDIPFMQGYRGNPGQIIYFNGAKPVHV